MATKNPRPDFPTTIVTPVFRLSYPAVFTPVENQLRADRRKEYRITMLFDKKTAATDLKEMKELMAKIAIWKWGQGVKGLKNPFFDGDTVVYKDTTDLKKDKNPTIAGMIFVNSWSKNPPGVVDAKTQPVLDSDEIYGGCYCRAQLNAYAYEFAGNKGVNFGLLHLQKVKDGDPFGQKTRPEDAFAPVDDTESTAEQAAPSGGDSMFS